VTAEQEMAAVPRSLKWVSVAVLIGSIAMIFVGALRIGVTWDEPLHVERLNNYLDTGWYLGQGQLDDGEPGPAMKQQYVYAPAAMLMLHGLCVVTGVEEPDSVSVSADAYAVRHLGIGLISMLGILAVAATGRLLFRRWDWALVAAATLAVVPLWSGHSMFNLKDVPVGTGYALVTLGLGIIARGAQGRDWRLRLGGPAALACGTFLAMGTRPGMWTGIFASVAVLIGCWLLRPREGSFLEDVRADLWRYRDLAAGLVVAGLGLWAIDPKVFSSPFHAMWRAAFASANFLDAQAPWTFVPVRVFLQVPFLLLCFAGLGTFLAVRRTIRTKLRPGVDESRQLVVLVQMLALPVIAIVHGASLYGDLRQLLFSVPATALIATLGIHHLVVRSRTGPKPRRLAPVALVACIALAAPLVDQATLFPYNYAYYNPLADVAQVTTDGEYYRGSGRELVPQLPKEGRIVCSPTADEDGNAMRMAHLDGWVDCASAVYSPISAYADQRRANLPALSEDEFWAITFGRGTGSPDNCERLTGVTRGTGWRRFKLATLYRCERAYPVLGTGAVRFEADSTSRSFDFPDLGWIVPMTDGTPVGFRSNGGPSTMKFLMSEDFAGHDVKLLIDTSAPPEVTVTFAGSAVESRPGASSTQLEILIPRALVDGAIESPAVLEFRSSTSTPLELKVLQLRAVPNDQS
jgi:hypothetical protein